MCRSLSVAEATTAERKPISVVQTVSCAVTLIALAILSSMHASASVHPLASQGANVYFEKNQGQHSSGYFRAIGKGFAVSFDEARANIFVRRGTATSINFLGARPARPVGEIPAGVRVDYLRGKTSKNWHLGVPTFRQVRYTSLYPGIDAVFYGKGKALEYDFIVNPGADPSRIRFRVEGTNDMAIDSAGALVVYSGSGTIMRHARPIAWQETRDGRRTPVNVAFSKSERGEISFQLGDYRRSNKLIIDPVLTFSTYLGADMDDEGVDAAVDGDGNIYVLGNVLFPSNAPGTFGENRDMFLYKLNPSGTTVLYAAVIGGTYAEYARGLAIDGSGKAYITGSTSSSDFPITATAYLTTPRKTPNSFLCVVDTNKPVGESLVYSTHFPADVGNAVALDFTGKVYMTGAASWGFVTTPGAFQSTCPTCSYTKDAFVAKFDITRTGAGSLIYSTYLGGSAVPVLGTANDEGLSIAVDSTGEAVVVGSASSSDFPTRNALDSTYNSGITDAFITRLNAAGTGLVFSTLLGTDSYDSANAVTLDQSGNIYVAGSTNGDGLPTTPGAWQRHWNLNQCGSAGYNRPCPDAFVIKLSATGSLLYATYLGGFLPDYGNDIAVDGAGNAWITGHSISYDFPLVNQLSGVSTGANDAFVTKLNATGTNLLFSTMIGGDSKDEGKAIALSGNDVVLVGTTLATDFPVVNAFQPANQGGTDAFILKFAAPSGAATLSAVTVSPASVPGGTNATGTAVLGAAAPAGGVVVTLTSSNTAAATVPASVAIPAGSTSATFVITSRAVTSSTALTISAAYGGTTKTAALTVTPAPAALSALTVTPASVVGTVNATGTVTLTKAAPAGGTVVTIASNKSTTASVPASVTVAAGATTATFNITTTAVTTNTAVTISAAYSGVSKTAALTVTPLLSGVTVSPTSVAGGMNATGTVTLGKAAPAGGTAIALTSSNTTAAVVPASVTVPAGANTASFTIGTKPVAATTAATISATYAGVTKTAALSVTNAPTLSSLSLSPASVTGTANSVGSVVLTKAAPTGGAVVTLISSNTAAAVPPASVTVPAGAASATFTIATKSVTASTRATISASFGGATKTATLTVTPILSSVKLLPTSLTGGANSVGTVTLGVAAPAGGAVVTLSSSNAAVAKLPATVTVAAGAKTAQFTIATVAVTAPTGVTISATYAGSTRSATLTVNPVPPAVSSLVVSPTSVRGGATATGTVTLSKAAPAGGTLVALASGNVAVATVPSSVTVPAGTLSSTFPVTTKPVVASATVTIQASSTSGVTKTASIGVTP